MNLNQLNKEIEEAWKYAENSPRMEMHEWDVVKAFIAGVNYILNIVNNGNVHGTDSGMQFI